MGCVAPRPRPERFSPSFALEWMAAFRFTRCRVRQSTALQRERPTSRPCSADESVARNRRCQRSIARVSHGLLSPSRSIASPAGPFRGSKAEAFGFRWKSPHRGGEASGGCLSWPVARSGGTRNLVLTASCGGVPHIPSDVGRLLRPPACAGLGGRRCTRSLSGSASRRGFPSVSPVARGSVGSVPADLHGVSDVKERSEERLYPLVRRSSWCPSVVPVAGFQG
jgi:hypothetical protein